MSCFRARTSGAKLAAGLARLAADIADRSIDRIIAESLNDIGDYCFIAMTRAAALRRLGRNARPSAAR